MDSDKFIHHYLECLLWSEVDDNDRPLDDNYGIEDIDSQSLKEATEECKAFLLEASSLLEEAGIEADQAGHDFCLSRNGHGAGFWDRGLGDIGNKLHSITKSYGSVTAYPSNGKIFFS